MEWRWLLVVLLLGAGICFGWDLGARPYAEKAVWRLGSAWVVLAVWHFVPPVVEEAAKAAPLVLYLVRKPLCARSRFFAYGYGLGLGFGVGEIWVAVLTRYHALPALLASLAAFGERFLVAFAHAALTGLVGRYLAEQRGWQGYGVAVGAHALANVGVTLALAYPLHPLLIFLPIAAVALGFGVYVEKTLRTLTATAVSIDGETPPRPSEAE